MKKKISVIFLITVIVTMINMCALASEVKLISPRPKTNSSYSNLENVITSTIDKTIKVQLNGEIIDFTDEQNNVVNPEIINDRTMVPMRKIFEMFDANIFWNNETRTVKATTEEKEIILTIDSEKAILKNIESNEEKEITLDAAPVILNDRTMVPVRFIAESLEKEVGWDVSNKTVVIVDYDKVESLLKEKVPVLQKIFELEVKPLDSFKSESKIEGKIIYKDPEEKSNNETIKITGNSEMNVNKEKEMEMYTNLKFTGKGKITDSLKEANLEKINFAIIAAGGNIYSMFEIDDEKEWIDLTSKGIQGIDLNIISEAIKNIKQPKSYKEYIEILKTSLGELDITTYQKIQTVIDIMSEIYNEENFEFSGTAAKKTVKYELDIISFLESLLGEIMNSIEGVELKVSMTEKIIDKTVDSVNAEILIAFEEAETKESVEMNIEFDMEFDKINKDFDIKLPEIE